MGYILTILSGFSFFKRRDDDDLVDRMHYYFTTNLLIMLAILVSFKQFGGSPIECMVPDQFPHAWEEYAESYCWAQDTYFLPFKQVEAPTDEAQRYETRISYYQWVPFFLIIQAVSFSLPAMTWHILCNNSGMNIAALVKVARDQNNIKPEIRKTTIDVVTKYLENALRFHRRLKRRGFVPHKIFRCLNFPYQTVYITIVYLSTKLFYLANVLLQFYVMNKFLQVGNYQLYGFDALRDLMSGTKWQNSGIFPRVTLCDFDVRVMANVQPYTMQCVLVINLFNEKIFIFLWFWYCILSILTLCSFLYWFILLPFPRPARWFIVRHLQLSDMPFNESMEKKHTEKFVGNYLRPDGVFVLRMIILHTGVIFGTELIAHLWKSFYGIENEYQRQKSESCDEQPSALKDTHPKALPDALNFLRLRSWKRAPSVERGTETELVSKGLFPVSDDDKLLSSEVGLTNGSALKGPWGFPKSPPAGATKRSIADEFEEGGAALKSEQQRRRSMKLKNVQLRADQIERLHELLLQDEASHLSRHRHSSPDTAKLLSNVDEAVDRTDFSDAKEDLKDTTVSGARKTMFLP